MYLHIFDTSQYICAGVGNAVVTTGVVEDAGCYRSKEIPCAGVNMLLNTVHEFAKEGNELVYVFDTIPSIKRELHTLTFPTMDGYKGNRPKKPRHIQYQREMAEEILKHIGFNCIKSKGYEADDCIASLVKACKNDYEHIFIHNKDSDLFYLVDDNVTIVPVGAQGKTVTKSNYETTVNRDYEVKYNALTIHKLLHGEMGDNIPKISDAMCERIRAALVGEDFTKFGDNDYVREFVAKVTDHDYYVMNTLNLILTLDVPAEDIELYETDYDEEVYKFYARALGAKYAPKVAKDSPVGVEIIERYVDRYMGGE